MSNAVYNVEVALRSFASTLPRRDATKQTATSAGPKVSGPVDIFLAITDHFEPQVGQPTQAVARARLDEWLRRYPQITRRHRDADGRTPRHSFFYPYDESDAWELARLSELCASGCGEIELHLHHRDDTAETLTAKIQDALKLYRTHGALSSWPDGRPAFAFIHGNWALDNSRIGAGGRNYCGVNNEVTVLASEGCYADFTFPAWQQTAQPRQINSIYYAVDDPEKPKSHDRGEPARAGVAGKTGPGTLLLIQGPLVPFLNRGRRGILPRPAMDDGDLAFSRRYSPERLDRWIHRAGVQVKGRPDRIFVKLFTHGAADRNREALLGQDLDALFTDAEARYNDGANYRLHYVTAREMYNVVKATEANADGDINTLRDFALPPPAASAPVVTETSSPASSSRVPAGSTSV